MAARITIVSHHAQTLIGHCNIFFVEYPNHLFGFLLIIICIFKNSLHSVDMESIGYNSYFLPCCAVSFEAQNISSAEVQPIHLLC